MGGDLRQKGIDTMTKMTYGKALAYVLDNCTIPEDVSERLTTLAAQLAKKNGAERKPTAIQVANEGYKAAIVAFMTPATMYTVTDVIKGCEAVEGFSNQKVSALMRQLEQEGVLEKVVDKRKSYFQLVEVEDEEEE